MTALRSASAGIALFALLAAASGCSVQRFAANQVADTLAASGSTYSSDDDPELVEAALPFSLKLMESVLASTPEHRGLLAATCAGFTQYSWGFVQQEGDAFALEDTDRAWESWNRARRLYLRARDYCLRGLDTALPGFRADFATTPAATAARAGTTEVDLLYWGAAAWAAAIALGKDDPALVAELPQVSALIDRALAVDEDWNRGAIHDFLVTYTMVRPDVAGDRAALARRHFERALELAAGKAAGPHLSWAEAWCLPREDRACFEESLRAALAVDADAEPESRLANLIMQRRAAWLLANVDHWILPPLPEGGAEEGQER
jgi:predicted anti-sigma-YlaC factor YlaD